MLKSENGIWIWKKVSPIFWSRSEMPEKPPGNRLAALAKQQQTAKITAASGLNISTTKINQTPVMKASITALYLAEILPTKANTAAA